MVGVVVGAVVSVGDSAGDTTSAWVAVGTGELQADAIRVTMIDNNMMNLILGFICIP
jgi:hypothetical protein